MLMLLLQTGIWCDRRPQNLFAGISMVMNLSGGAKVNERRKAPKLRYLLGRPRGPRKRTRWHCLRNVTEPYGWEDKVKPIPSYHLMSATLRMNHRIME